MCASDVEGFQFGQPLQEVWLQRLQTDHLGRVLIEDGIPKVLDSVNVALPDLGFGLSQMLPILTQYHYQAEEQDSLSLSTLTVEQPELHLHPSWQAELAQILSGAVKEGEKPQSVTQMIVETHSEHFIQRIRNMFLSGLFPDLSFRDKKRAEQYVRFIALEVNASDRTSSPKEVFFTKRGDFDAVWPHGFFPDDRLRRHSRVVESSSDYQEE